MFGRTGANHPNFGITPTNAFQSGALNPMYGKVAAHAMTINVYSINNKLVHSFTSQVAAANWLNIPRTSFQNFLSSGKVWNHQYIF
jgi:hypothetical protein